MFIALLGMLVVAGCAGRTVNIQQEDLINTAMHKHRPPEQRTGEPLEVDVVAVFPEDIDREVNARLRAESGITIDEWFDRRPVPGDEGKKEGNHFQIPKDQVFTFTNKEEKDIYGQKVGAALQGAAYQKDREMTSEIKFKSSFWHASKSVIYVFPKFTDETGEVIKGIRPAMFSPPSKYPRELRVKIGVRDPDGANPEQYIEILSEKE